MNRIDIKPLTVNQVWRGRRFKTPAYTDYENNLFLLLPKIEVPKGKLELTLIFGFSNKASDIDNPVKPILDVLQKAYGFNDKMIYRLHVEKKDVEKGKEYIIFDFQTFDDYQFHP